MPSSRWDYVELAPQEGGDRRLGSDSLNRPHTVGKQREKFNK